MSAKNNQVLKEIINNSWSGIGIIDKTSKFIFVNEAFKPILGFSRDELLDLSFESLLLDKYKDGFEELLVKNIESEYSNNMIVGCLRKDKQIVYLDISIHLMSNKKYIVINVNDITKNISDHETFDKYVIQLHVDKEGIINQVSEAFCRFTLFTSEELIGKHYNTLVHKDINEDELEDKICTAIKEDTQWTGVIASKNKHGDNIWVDVIIKSIKNKYGDTTGYSAVMFDITNEINLQKSTEALEETIVDNEAKLEIMTDTMRTVAHEWRQPLNTISLDAQNLLVSYILMDEKVSKDEAVPVLESMQKNIEGLSSIISKFQYITEFRADKKDIVVNDLCKKAIDESYVSKDIVNFQSLVNENIKTYDEPVIKAIVSILDNAQDAINKSQTEDEKFIDFKVVKLKDNVYFEISNNGGHISNDVIDKIFAPYFSTKEIKNGVGLSLYISKMIIEFHLKGKIKVINKDKDIVEFTITLPL